MAEKIGRFEILDKIGDGALGSVYRAQDPTVGRTVALKTLRVDARLGPEARSLLVREARSAGTLSHPNIVSIYDVNDEAQVPYVAMEYVDGQSLAALIADAAPFRPAAILPWIDQIADGLDYAHRRGVVHRDLKPAN